MSSSQSNIVLYETVTEDCPYLEGHTSASVIVDPQRNITPELFSSLSHSGFRRSGETLYIPNCPNCQKCISVRIPVSRFIASKSQKRIWKRNQDLRVSLEPLEFSQEHFDLYLAYQRARHPDSTMHNDDTKAYFNFIHASYSDSQFLCLRENDTLIAVNVLDQFQHGLSAVYTYFSPEHAKRSLGTFTILYLIALAQTNRVPHVYLGYWVKNSIKMAYKKNFTPIEGYINQKWQDI